VRRIRGEGREGGGEGEEGKEEADFPQQRLHERALLLRYTHTVCSFK